MSSNTQSRPSLKTVQTSMLKISYEESGPPLNSSSSSSNPDTTSPRPPPIVLLHGWPYSIRQYDAVVSALTTKHQKHTILVPWLRGFGDTQYLDPTEARAGQQAAITQDLIEFLDALSIPRALLVGYDWGGRAACCLAALHPQRVVGLITCQGYAIQNVPVTASTPPSPFATRAQWYQYYLNMPTGARCLEIPESRNALVKYLWELWSPNWKFSDDEFAEATKCFENKDFVATTLHSYRYRWATVPGQASLARLEAELSKEPSIEVPTIAVRGGSDGIFAPDLASDADAKRFPVFYERVILPSVGHCPPAEDPEAVVTAIERLFSLNTAG